MHIRKEPLDFYVEKLKQKKYFSLARYGDGEWFCIWGRKGQNSNGCLYTWQLQRDLRLSLHHYENDFIFGMQRILPKDLERAHSYLHPRKLNLNKWFDSEIFGDALAEGKLYPFIEQLKKMRIVVIGNASLRPIKDIINYEHFIEVPASNAHIEKDRIYAEVKALGPAVFLFSCGMAATVFVSELHGLDNSFLLDVGHIWDPFVGQMSRCNLEHLTKKDIERNLHA